MGAALRRSAERSGAMGILFGNTICLFFAWLFGRAVAHKLYAPAYYRELLAVSFPIPGAAGTLLALTTTLELVLVALLFLPGSRATGLTGCALLLLIYAAFMAWQLWQGRVGMSCGCSGANSTLVISLPLVLRNIACAILAFAATLYTVSWGGWPQVVAALALALILAAAYLLFEQALANAQYMNEDV